MRELSSIGRVHPDLRNAILLSIETRATTSAAKSMFLQRILFTIDHDEFQIASYTVRLALSRVYVMQAIGSDGLLSLLSCP